MISVGHRNPVKDTLANLRANGEAVVHVAESDLLPALHQSGAEYRADISELETLGLVAEASDTVRPPRLQQCPIAFECTLDQELAVGSPASAVCFLQVQAARIDDDRLGADGLPDVDAIRALGRLGDRSYLESAGWTTVAMDKQVLDASDQRPRGSSA